MTEINEKVIVLKGEKIVPDIVHEYTPKIRNGSIPIVIDNGNFFRFLLIFSQFLTEIT